MRRKRGYIAVDFLGEARIIKGRSHKVKRIKGDARGSVKRMEDIGVILFKRGMLIKVIRKDEMRHKVILYIRRDKKINLMRERVIGIIQVAKGSRSWAPKAHIFN